MADGPGGVGKKKQADGVGAADQEAAARQHHIERISQIIKALPPTALGSIDTGLKQENGWGNTAISVREEIPPSEVVEALQRGQQVTLYNRINDAARYGRTPDQWLGMAPGSLFSTGTVKDLKAFEHQLKEHVKKYKLE